MFRFAVLVAIILALLAVAAPVDARHHGHISHHHERRHSHHHSRHVLKKKVQAAEHHQHRSLVQAHAEAKVHSKALAATWPNPADYSFTKATPIKAAQMSSDAQLAMVLNGISYLANSYQNTKTTSAQGWATEIKNAANRLGKAPFGRTLATMTVETSNYDQAVMSATVGGKLWLFAGGHGSETARDWLGQNTDASGIVNDAAKALNFLGSAFNDGNLGTNTLPDIELRSTRLQGLVQQTLQKYGGRVTNVLFFGHSMSGLADAQAALAIQKANPKVTVNAYSLNPGGPQGCVVAPFVHNFVIPGEILTKLHIGSNKDSMATPLILANPDMSQINSIKGPIYLHLEGALLDDINKLY